MGNRYRAALGLLVLLSLGSIVFPVVGVPWLLVLVVGGGGVWRGLGRGGFGNWLTVLDEAIFEGERWLVAVSLVVMAGVVFLDVVWRSASGLDPETSRNLAVGFFVLVMVGAFTARAPKVGASARLVRGLVVYGLCAGAVWLIVQAENGFGWSQRLALVLVIWVGLIGGSMATRLGRHIAVDAVRRVVPARFARVFELVSGGVTVFTCAFLAVVGAMYCRGNFDDWLMTERRAFLFESLPIPYWGATLAMPVGFGLMAARFLALTLTGGGSAAGEDFHGSTSRLATPSNQGERA